MASRKRVCVSPGCPSLVEGGGRCGEHTKRRTGAHRALYNRRRWRRGRRNYLARNPLCVMCVDEGRTEAATVVDHIEPHRGDRALFWDVSNWQSLCKTHHDRKTGHGF